MKVIHTKTKIVPGYRLMNDVILLLSFFSFLFGSFQSPLHACCNPPPFLFLFSFFLVGYKVKLDSRSMFGLNPRVLEEEIARKKEEYLNNAEIKQISKECEMEKASI